MDDEPSTERSHASTASRRSRRAFLGLTAGTLAAIAGCTGPGDPGDDERPDDTPADSPTDGPTPTGTGPDESPTPVDPESLAVTGVSVQSSALGRRVMDAALSLTTADGWLVFVSLGTAGGTTPDRAARTFQDAPGYPAHGALELRVAGARDLALEAARPRNVQLLGDARGAWTAFEMPDGTRPDSATVEWPAEGVTLGDLPGSALDRLADEAPAFALESFVAGEPDTTPGPSPTGSPTPGGADARTMTVDYELTVRNEGGAGTLRGYLDHETPKERAIADYSGGGDRLRASFDAGETRTLAGEYEVRYREGDATVPVRAVVPGAEVTSRVATGE
jgi:hypothetical protein